jgi:hypothetical protein
MNWRQFWEEQMMTHYQNAMWCSAYNDDDCFSYHWVRFEYCQGRAAKAK